MLPLRNTASTVCLSQTNFIALISTAVVITAAATFWCTRRLRTCAVKPHRPQLATPKAAPVAALATNSPSSPSTNNYNPAAAVTSDDCSYLCSSCGTEKYSADQLAASQNFSSKSSPYKMVILVRTDLNMGKGKAAAQCCHAVLAAYKSASSKSSDTLKRWEREGQPKVTLKIDTETEMIELMHKARSAGIVAESIRDAGRTQVAAGTRTVCAIGPAPAKLIDSITGHLKLY